MYLVKTVFALIFTLIVSISIPSPILAAVARGTKIKANLGGLSLSPNVGGYFFAGSEQRDVTLSYGLKIGYDKIGNSIADSLGVEGSFNYFTTSSKTHSIGDNGYLLRLDAIYLFVLDNKWLPFLAVGVGGIEIDNVKYTNINPLFNYGIGVKYFLEDYLALRADVRHLLVYDSYQARNNYEVGIGMSYYFGKERKKKPAPPQPVKQEDKKTVVLEETPVAPPSPTFIPYIHLASLLALQPVAEPYFQAESDIVEEPAGETVREKIVREMSINFDVARYNIKPVYLQKLKEIAGVLKSSVGTSARIEGHTDSSGTLSYNVKLSEMRAQNARKSLIGFGVNPKQIYSVYYGPSRPISENATEEGKLRNRRVDTFVTLLERIPNKRAAQTLQPGIRLNATDKVKPLLNVDVLLKASINASITLSDSTAPFSVGSTSSLPFEISNNGFNTEEYNLSVAAVDEISAFLTSASKPDDKVTRLKLAAGELFKGAVKFRIPAETVDGHRYDMSIKAVSAKFNEISFHKETVITSTAPIVYVDAKLTKPRVSPGEKLSYTVSVINSGSLDARNLTVRLHLPPQVEFLGTTDTSVKQEANGPLVFKVDTVKPGKKADILLDIKIREDSTIGQEISGQIEMIDDNVHRKDIFTASVSVIADLKAEQELLNRLKLERLQTEKLAREGIHATINLPEAGGAIPVGGYGNLPVDITNNGISREAFLLTIAAPEEFDAALVDVDRPDKRVTRLQLAAGETFKGVVAFKMPAELPDGHRTSIMIDAVSTSFGDVRFHKEVAVISSAPVIRVDSKLAKSDVVPGEKLRYNITVLNAGSSPARNLSVRLQLPPQLEVQGTLDASYKKQPNGIIVFSVDLLEKGKSAEMSLDVKVRENSAAGQELRGQIEVVNHSLQRKDSFTSSTSVIREK
jgi:OOP family OmpA-OmpF porin